MIFHCHVGSRSLMAAQAFRQAGFEAYSMAGGLEQWEQEGRPVQTGRRLNDEGPAQAGPSAKALWRGGLDLGDVDRLGALVAGLLLVGRRVRPRAASGSRRC